MGPTWHNGQPMSSREYIVVQQNWLGNKMTIRNYKETKLVNTCRCKRGRGQFMTWRCEAFVDADTVMLLFEHNVGLESENHSDRGSPVNS